MKPQLLGGSCWPLLLLRAVTTGLMTHTYSLSTPEAEAGITKVQGKHGLHRKTCFVFPSGAISCLHLDYMLSFHRCVFPLKICDNQQEGWVFGFFFSVSVLFFFLIRIICNFRCWVLFLGRSHFSPTPVWSSSLRLHLFWTFGNASLVYKSEDPHPAPVEWPFFCRLSSFLHGSGSQMVDNAWSPTSSHFPLLWPPFPFNGWNFQLGHSRLD